MSDLMPRSRNDVSAPTVGVRVTASRQRSSHEMGARQGAAPCRRAAGLCGGPRKSADGEGTRDRPPDPRSYEWSGVALEVGGNPGAGRRVRCRRPQVLQRHSQDGQGPGHHRHYLRLFRGGRR
jgi:hypothetical protein